MSDAWDTNVLVRLLVADDPAQTDQVRELAASLSPQRPARLTKIVLVETYWVLTRGYSVSREDTIRGLKGLLSVPDFAIEDEAQVSRALDSALDGADLPDALLHEAALAAGVDVVTFDKAAAKRFGWHLLASNDGGSGSDAQ